MTCPKPIQQSLYSSLNDYLIFKKSNKNVVITKIYYKSFWVAKTFIPKNDFLLKNNIQINKSPMNTRPDCRQE